MSTPERKIEADETDPAGEALFRRILFATDLTPSSENAFAEALRIAKGCGAFMTILHAYNPGSIAGVGFVPAHLYDEWDQKIREGISENLKRWIDRAANEDVSAMPLIVAGFPDQAILETAHRQGADLIVLGTHGRTGVPRLFLGSVASRVVAESDCPVLTVRPA
jgi:nucleotide-binding universal stress UspA family protein